MCEYYRARCLVWRSAGGLSAMNIHCKHQPHIYTTPFHHLLSADSHVEVWRKSWSLFLLGGNWIVWVRIMCWGGMRCLHALEIGKSRTVGGGWGCVGLPGFFFSTSCVRNKDMKDHMVNKKQKREGARNNYWQRAISSGKFHNQTLPATVKLLFVPASLALSRTYYTEMLASF